MGFAAPDKKLLQIQCAVKIIGKDDAEKKGNIAEPQHDEGPEGSPHRGWMRIVVGKKAQQPA